MSAGCVWKSAGIAMAEQARRPVGSEGGRLSHLLALSLFPFFYWAGLFYFINLFIVPEARACFCSAGD